MTPSIRKSAIRLDGKDMAEVMFDELVDAVQRTFFIDLFSGKFNSRHTFYQICNIASEWGYTHGYNQAADEANKSTNG